VDRTTLSFGVNLGRLGPDGDPFPGPVEPFVMLGVRRAQRWGITSWCTPAPSGLAPARVIAEVRS
jgi:hypothetical protein